MNAKLVLYILGGMGLVSGAIMLISFNPLFDFILKKVIILLLHIYDWIFFLLMFKEICKSSHHIFQIQFFKFFDWDYLHLTALMKETHFRYVTKE